jgi:hypothetical protein
MAKIHKSIEKVSQCWQEMPVETRNKILARVKTVHTAAKELGDLCSKCFLESLTQLVKDGAVAAINPMGPGVEGVVIEVCGAIPELSAYFRQLMRD